MTCPCLCSHRIINPPDSIWPNEKWDILALREEGQTALVVYAGDAHTVTPLTDDVVTIESLVPSLSPNIMPLFGSNPVAAVELAIGLLDEVEATEDDSSDD